MGMLLVVHQASLCAPHDYGDFVWSWFFRVLFGYLADTTYSIPYAMHLGICASIGGCD